MPAKGTGLAGELGFMRRENPAAYMKAWKERNRERYNEYYRERHAEKMARDPEYRAMKRASSAAARRKKKYGVDRATYEAMVESQSGRCLICKEAPDDDNLRVDHNHATGEVRGLLCNQCNSALGLLGDDPSRLWSAFEYLLKRGDYAGVDQDGSLVRSENEKGQ